MKKLLFFFLFLFPIFIYSQAGELDNKFGKDGIVITNMGGMDDYGHSVAVQSDGKIVVAGYSNGKSLVFDVVVARYNDDGSLDNTFGTNGMAFISFGGFDNYGYGVAIQTDGKIVVAGWTKTASERQFLVIRLNTNGSTDNTFGTNGIVTTSFGIEDAEAYAVAIQSDGKIVVTGTYKTDGFYNELALARYNTNGTLDNTFDSDGKVTTSIGVFPVGLSVVIQSDGKIVAVGTAGAMISQSDFIMARYNSDGSLDNSFGTSGKVISDFGATQWAYGTSVALQSDGKIVACGYAEYTSQDFVVARFTTSGGFDPSFGATGYVTINFSEYDAFGRSVAVQKNGKIVIGGYVYDSKGTYLFALARVNSNGELDNKFGNSGKVLTDINNIDYGRSLKIQEDGNILLAGYTENEEKNYDFAIARYIGDIPAINLNTKVFLQGAYR